MSNLKKTSNLEKIANAGKTGLKVGKWTAEKLNHATDYTSLKIRGFTNKAVIPAATLGVLTYKAYDLKCYLDNTVLRNSSDIVKNVGEWGYTGLETLAGNTAAIGPLLFAIPASLAIWKYHTGKSAERSSFRDHNEKINFGEGSVTISRDLKPTKKLADWTRRKLDANKYTKWVPKAYDITKSIASNKIITPAATLAAMGHMAWYELGLQNVQYITDVSSFAQNLPGIATGILGMGLAASASKAVMQNYLGREPTGLKSTSKVLNDQQTFMGRRSGVKKFSMGTKNFFKNKYALALSLTAMVSLWHAIDSTPLSARTTDVVENQVRNVFHMPDYRLPSMNGLLERTRIPELPAETALQTTRTTGYVNASQRKVLDTLVSNYDKMEYLSEKFKLDKNFFKALLWTESKGRHFDRAGNALTSPDGAVGLGQLMPCVIQDLNFYKFIETGDSSLVDLVKKDKKGNPIYKGKTEGHWSWKKAKNDPTYNMFVSATWLKLLSGRYKGNNDNMAAAYNAGFPQIDIAIRGARSDNINKYKGKLSNRAQRETVQYVTLINDLESALDYADKNFVWPTDSVRITSPFGPRGKGTHYGLDIGGVKASVAGDPIRAAADGEVLSVNWLEANGQCVKIAHKAGLETVYLHMGNGSITVKPGDKVDAGDVIGTMASTGRSGGVHLHFETRVGGRNIDPAFMYDLTHTPESSISDETQPYDAQPGGFARLKNYLANAIGKFTKKDTPDTKTTLPKTKTPKPTTATPTPVAPAPKPVRVDVDQSKLTPTYSMVSGDKLYKLASQYYTDLGAFEALNPGITRRARDLQPGDSINLPDTFNYHTVQKGQGLEDIAFWYDMDPVDLRARNDLSSSSLKENQRIRVPKTQPKPFVKYYGLNSKGVPIFNYWTKGGDIPQRIADEFNDFDDNLRKGKRDKYEQIGPKSVVYCNGTEIGQTKFKANKKLCIRARSNLSNGGRKK